MRIASLLIGGEYGESSEVGSSSPTFLRDENRSELWNLKRLSVNLQLLGRASCWDRSCYLQIQRFQRLRSLLRRWRFQISVLDLDYPCSPDVQRLSTLRNLLVISRMLQHHQKTQH